jgi:hypothetical protein
MGWIIANLIIGGLGYIALVVVGAAAGAAGM